jgi:hypothetical protein
MSKPFVFLGLAVKSTEEVIRILGSQFFHVWKHLMAIHKCGPRLPDHDNRGMIIE